MKEIVLITGAKGLVATRLSKILANSYTVRFLTRHKQSENEFEWDVDQHFIDAAALIGVDHIIHLAGANIAGKRWNKTSKKEIIRSRVESAQLLFNALKEHNLYIKSFISASAIGFYDSTNRAVVNTEESLKGVGFLADLVEQWEQSADQFLTSGIANRVVKVRSGVILDSNKGALPKMVMPIKNYIGSPLGDGNQFIPWIHIDDICNLYKFVLDQTELNGVYNGVAPSHTTNKLFTKEIARILNKPLVLPAIPKMVFQILFGEGSFVILEGSMVSSEKIEKAGFQFQYCNLADALKQLLS